MPKLNKIAFVLPWYGKDIIGGAEFAVRDIMHHLLLQGISCEVLTTCVDESVQDQVRPYNAHFAEVDRTGEVPIRRFAVAVTTPTEDEFFSRFLSDYRVPVIQDMSIEKETTLLNIHINSDQLYSYIRYHKDEYSLFVFVPYLFSTGYFGSAAAGEKAVMIPCLHDEPYAYLKLFKERFSQLSGMIFLSPAEEQLANQLYDLSNVKTQVIGLGVKQSEQGNAIRFREKFGIQEPFMLYVGRKVGGKGVDALINYFVRYKKQYNKPFKLVLAGGGKLEETWADDFSDIIDLGFVSEEDKIDAFAAASIFCLPSSVESFSISTMESWVQACPVMVNGTCAVTKSFVQQAKGGLYFENYAQFAACVEKLQTDETLRAQLGKNGQLFVQQQFSWEYVTQQYIQFFEEIKQAIQLKSFSFSPSTMQTNKK